MKKKYKVIALFGKSGVGKDTIKRWLLETFKDINEIIGYTSRPPRAGEVEGVEYHFVDEEYFFTHHMLEMAEFRKWYYGTSEEGLDTNKINIGVFNIQGIQKLLYNDNIEVIPVEITIPSKIRLIRSLNREVNPDCKEICRRFLSDEEDFSKISFCYKTYNNEDIVISPFYWAELINNFDTEFIYIDSLNNPKLNK